MPEWIQFVQTWTGLIDGLSFDLIVSTLLPRSKLILLSFTVNLIVLGPSILFWEYHLYSRNGNNLYAVHIVDNSPWTLLEVTSLLVMAPSLCRLFSVW